MAADRARELAQDTARRSVLPKSTGRTLWLVAAWTGAGAAIVCATVSIIAVAICWLPVSGTTGRAHSAIHAGLLTFLAALHGGVTVNGTAATFLPLGMTIAVALTAWRAGSALADAATERGERDPVRLLLAGATQAASFMIAALIAVPFATLGTSSAPFLAVGVAAFLLFAVAGGGALVRSSALREELLDLLPSAASSWVRAAVVGVAVYLGSGALLVAGSLIVHHGRVEVLSHQVGGGWGGVPILLLGVLAAPNAVITGASYLAGPGFSFGAGVSVSATATTHGTVPAFPLLGGLPTGHGAPSAVWWLMVATWLLAGLLIARLVARTDGWLVRLRDAAVASVLAGVVMMVLAWQGGGSIGAGQLSTIGAPAGRFGLMVAGELAVVSLLSLGLVAAWQWLAGLSDVDDRTLLIVRDLPDASAQTSTAQAGTAGTGPAPADVTPDGDADGTDVLAG
ncbi:MAG: DUF6350 family protein [Jatrophihabitantaceae bacterium]